MEKRIELAIGFNNLSDTESIEEKLKQIEFTYIWGFTGGISLMNEKQTEDYVKFLNENKLTIEQVHCIFGSEYDLSHPDPSKRYFFIEGMKSEIEKMKYMGVKNYVIHCSNTVEESERGERKKIFMNSMERILPFAEKVKMKIALENTAFKQNVIGTAEELVEICEKFNSQYLGVCFDTGHANLTEDPKREFLLLKDKIFTFHIHDNDGERDLHLPPPFGIFDWQWFIKEIKDLDVKILPMEFLIPEKIGFKQLYNIVYKLFNNKKRKFCFGKRNIEVL